MWKGYDEPTWEPKEYLSCADLIREYEDSVSGEKSNDKSTKKVCSLLLHCSYELKGAKRKTPAQTAVKIKVCHTYSPLLVLILF